MISIFISGSNVTDLCMRKAYHVALCGKNTAWGWEQGKKRGRKALYMAIAIIQVRGDEVLDQGSGNVGF